ncbi:MAG: GAF domain-containing protein [Bryobacteraceae bacterium]
MPEISIVTPDGLTRTVPLDGDRLELAVPAAMNFAFLTTSASPPAFCLRTKRQRLACTRSWSKNGTALNGKAINEAALHPDRITAGHLNLIFDGQARKFQHRVVFLDAREETRPKTATVATHLSDGERSVTAGRIGALIKAGRELASHRPLEELFPMILTLAIEAVQAERGVLLTVEGEELVVQASSGGDFRISSGVRDRVLKEKASILLNDVQSDASFRGMESLVAQQVQMLMAVPLQTNDTVIGLIYVDSPTLIREFTKDDLNLLTVMANVAAIRIEHARLIEVEQAERILAKDLEQAAVIQRQLLPSHAPKVDGLQLAGYNWPCRTVGGDYYDFIPYADGR